VRISHSARRPLGLGRANTSPIAAAATEYRSGYERLSSPPTADLCEPDGVDRVSVSQRDDSQFSAATAAADPATAVPLGVVFTARAISALRAARAFASFVWPNRHPLSFPLSPPCGCIPTRGVLRRRLPNPPSFYTRCVTPVRGLETLPRTRFELSPASGVFVNRARVCEAWVCLTRSWFSIVRRKSIPRRKRDRRHNVDPLSNPLFNSPAMDAIQTYPCVGPPCNVALSLHLDRPNDRQVFGPGRSSPSYYPPDLLCGHLIPKCRRIRQRPLRDDPHTRLPNRAVSKHIHPESSVQGDQPPRVGRYSGATRASILPGPSQDSVAHDGGV